MVRNSGVALVTGASRGIGQAIALSLGEDGFHVAVNYVSDGDGAGRTVARIEEGGGLASAYRADVSSSEETKQLVEEVEGSLGPIAVVVANAGIAKDSLLARMQEDDWDKVVRVNLKGTYNVTRWAARPMMRRRAGRIIAISSVVALTGNIGQANYCASKAGVIGLIRALARELARYGITANAVAPGYIETDMTRSLPPETAERLKGSIPLGRLGTPQDVAEAVRFLASDGAAYITGQVLPICGGMSIGAIT